MQIQYKIALICLHIVSGTASPDLSKLLHLYSPSRSLCSAADTRKDPRGETLSIHWTCALDLLSSLCQAFVFTLFF